MSSEAEASNLVSCGNNYIYRLSYSDVGCLVHRMLVVALTKVRRIRSSVVAVRMKTRWMYRRTSQERLKMWLKVERVTISLITVKVSSVYCIGIVVQSVPYLYILVRVFSRDILKGRNIGVQAGGGGSWGCIIFWKI